MKRELTKGNIVEIKEMHFDRGIITEHWRLARILEIYPHSIEVQFIKKPNELIKLSMDGRDRAWK